MHILFIGYGKTSQRVAKHLFGQGHQITTISQSPKTDPFANHLIQDVHQLDLSQIPPVDWVYVLLSPQQSTAEAYQHTYLNSVQPIVQALADHPVQRIVVVSSTRVYGEHAGEYVDDETSIQPPDAQAEILHQMELAWLAAYPGQVTIIRPTGIYGSSVSRMCKLAQQTQHYPNIHYSNRIHVEDLARFLAFLTQLAQPAQSYIVSNNQSIPLHEVIVWFQQQLGLPLLSLTSSGLSGRKIYASRMLTSGFQLQHPDCFQDYLVQLQASEYKLH